MKALLEVGHFQRAGVSWERGWDYLSDRVALIHINEIRAGRSVLFGTGEVDFPGLMRRLKIIGAGRLSTNRIFPYIGAAGAQLVGVCDLDPEKAIRNARRFGGTVYGDFKSVPTPARKSGSESSRRKIC